MIHSTTNQSTRLHLNLVHLINNYDQVWSNCVFFLSTPALIASLYLLSVCLLCNGLSLCFLSLRWSVDGTFKHGRHICSRWEICGRSSEITTKFISSYCCRCNRRFGYKRKFYGRLASHSSLFHSLDKKLFSSILIFFSALGFDRPLFKHRLLLLFILLLLLHHHFLN